MLVGSVDATIEGYLAFMEQSPSQAKFDLAQQQMAGFSRELSYLSGAARPTVTRIAPTATRVPPTMTPTATSAAEMAKQSASLEAGRAGAMATLQAVIDADEADAATKP